MNERETLFSVFEENKHFLFYQHVIIILTYLPKLIVMYKNTVLVEIILNVYHRPGHYSIIVNSTSTIYYDGQPSAITTVHFIQVSVLSKCPSYPSVRPDPSVRLIQVSV